MVPEQRRQRPLVCGLQLQNFDDDTRQGLLPQQMFVGTLGCFVVTGGGKNAILSNNHVVAGENRGLRGADQILQAGGVTVGADLVATLTDFIALVTSPAGGLPALGNVHFNDIDAGIAELSASISFNQRYLATRAITDPTTGIATPLTAPSGTATAAVGDRVFKVGRTTGLTYGEVIDITTVVGPVQYGPRTCWFRRCFTVIDPRGGQFSDLGDSGSAIVKESTGEVLGLLFAGNGVDSYACPIDTVLSALSCSMV
ncbi:MAG TPA: hypothetical protein VFI31_25465 [Pirellulales bacterium]|nr:hypothetical protein [Pirellulales bacterium]